MREGIFRRALGLILIPVALIAGAVFATATVERSSAINSATALQESQALLVAMLDQETGARGYFVTRDLVFLQPWNKGTVDFQSELASARATDAGDRQLEQELAAQAQVAQTWHSVTAHAIADFRRTGRQPTVAQALARKAMVDRFRALNTAFTQTLESRRNAALSWATWLTVLVGAGLSLTLASGSALLLRRSLVREERRRRREAELRELLQVSATEEESRTLVIRHLERTIPGAGAAVFNRNHSDDRLEPSLSPKADQTPMRELPRDELHPRDCLAVRLSRPYQRQRGQQTLAQCQLCGKLPADVACEPLLVGGKVIGSVLVARDGRIPPQTRSQLRDIVTQAAPIIANQRNLSLAETRAASDSLTGLPNRRSADDAIKRMAAFASRAVSPLAAVLIDLDHFKQINDVHGHERGDEALAAVGNILASSLRASDFAARYGGEEFLVLLPGTARDQACLVAENLRKAIERLELPFGNLTASFGVAALPEDAGEPDELLRQADRALYAAKRSGRNRVEAAISSVKLPADGST